MIWLAEVDGFTCGGADILRIIKFVWTLLDIIFIIVPIGLILMIGVDFGKNVIASREDDMKKNTNLVLKRIIFCLALFLINPIVNAVVGVLSDSGIEVLNYAKCIEIATTEDLSQYEIEDPVKEYPVPEPVFGKDNNMTATDDDSDKEEESTYGEITTIMVGDSRTNGLKNSLDSNEPILAKVKFIAEDGKGYDWFKDSGKTQLEEEIKDKTEGNVVLWLGVNDIGNMTNSASSKNVLDNYINIYNDLANKYDKINFVVVSVTPVGSGYSFKNEKGEEVWNTTSFNETISAFNAAIKAGVDSRIKYCDISSKIKFSTQTGDPVHYNKATSVAIMEEIKNCL